MNVQKDLIASFATSIETARPQSATAIEASIEAKLSWFCLGHWQLGKTYKFHVSHHPHKQKMRIKLWEDGVMLFDTNDVADNSPKALQGGRLGVYFLGATKTKYSKLNYS